MLEIPISVSHRRDTVPAYVADYLNSAPRDPLAAEESSRKASVRINEAAPRKVIFILHSVPKFASLT